jgi:hypothetical protein
MGSLVQAIDESAARPAAARVLTKRRERFDEALAKTGYVDRGELLEVTEPDVARNDWSESPVIGTAKCADAAYAQIGGRYVRYVGRR